jgi:hypothetical protein
VSKPRKPVRIVNIASEPGLKPKERIELLALAMQELALMQSLVIIHGPDRAAALYIQRGGHIRFDDFGEPVILR